LLQEVEAFAPLSHRLKRSPLQLTTSPSGRASEGLNSLTGESLAQGRSEEEATSLMRVRPDRARGVIVGAASERKVT
jgi:hypothetical protein